MTVFLRCLVSGRLFLENVNVMVNVRVNVHGQSILRDFDGLSVVKNGFMIN